MKKYTTEYFKEKVFEKYGEEYEVLGECNSCFEFVSVKHNCGNIFKVQPNHFLNKNNPTKCPCLKKSKAEKFKETIHEKILNNKKGDGEEFRLIDEYTKNSDTLTFLHIPTGKHFKMTPNHFLTGRRPNFLSKNSLKGYHGIKRDTQWFKEEVRRITNGEFEVLGEYEKCDIPVLMRHNSDICRNHEFKIRPLDFLGSKNKKGQRCPVCSCHNRKPYYYENTLNKRFGKLGFSFSDADLENNSILVEHSCGGKFTRKLNYMMNESYVNEDSILCPHCKVKSRANLICETFLIDNGIRYISETNMGELGQLRYDFKIFTNEGFFLLELDGIQHKERIEYFDSKLSFEERQKRDLTKTNYAKENNIELVRIDIPKRFAKKQQEEFKQELKEILGHYKLL